MGAENTLKGLALAVDDDPSVCSLLVRKLSREGFDCVGASNGKEALELLRQRSFDVVISDLRMPEISGLALLDRCRTDYPQLAFLMVTAEDDVEVGVQAMKRGAVDYLVKPFNAQILVHNIERALEKKRLELELARYHHRLEEMVEDRTQELEAALRKIEQNYDDTLEALGAALDLRDAETAGHSRRVSLYSLEIAKAMGYSSEELKHLARGALLHDVGKMAVPDTILLKPGRLTAAETAIMQRHVKVGYEVVRRVRLLLPAAELVLSHHERYDGKGYPRGLTGEAIALGARIFAVADALDAITSDRPYRSALPFSAAHEEISSGSGRQFDPAVVRAFLSIPESVWEEIRRGISGSFVEIESCEPRMVGHDPSDRLHKDLWAL